MIRFIFNKYLIFSAIALILQQLIAASSTIWIAKLAEAIVEQKDILFFLGMFIGALIIVYVPGVLSQVLLEKAKYIAIQKNSLYFLERFKGDLSLIYDQASNEEHKPWFTHRISSLVVQAASNIYQISALSLNILLNILALGLIIHKELLYCYGISFIILFLGYKFSNKKVSKVASWAQKEWNQFDNTLIEGWNDIAAGNRYNISAWLKSFKRHLQGASTSSIAQLWLTSGLSSFIMLLATLPILFGITIIMLKGANAIVASAIVATLPRQIQIIQYAYEFFSYLFHWSSLKQQLSDYNAMLSKDKKSINLSERINWNEIKLKGIENNTPQTLLAYLRENPKCRVTIVGKNASGKSTLLALIKMEYKDDAFILPSKHTLTISSEDKDNGGSSGEYIVKAFQFIDKEVQSKILLLDEWDANLDSNNQKILSRMIDKWATEKTVIEVRHRVDLL